MAKKEITPKYEKAHYRGMTLTGGFVWGGFADNRHFFVKEVHKPDVQIDATTRQIGGKFYEMLECTDACLENGNAEWMAKHGYTFPSTRQHP